MLKINKAQWEWFGQAGHLIIGQDCRFHLCTKVGSYLVSTVGEYLPDSRIRDLFAESRGNPLEGKGDARRADWMKKFGYEDIGCDRKYETMVFQLTDPVKFCECGCGLPKPDSFMELDMNGYNDPLSAREGHLEMCDKFSLIKH